jgi:DAK2 domain fusion protein YloV
MSTAAQSAPNPPLAELDAEALVRWVTTGRDALEAARAEIDELNVYPVPDGDTGTNLHSTVAAAVDALAAAEDVPATPAGALSSLAQGALLGARGNSGVILSQLIRGLADAAGDAPVDARGLVRALAAGAEAAYGAVARPVEGTMLTVAREAARAAAGDGAESLAAVVRRAAAGARTALARTPDQLEVLRRAGVVDAGGRGVCVLLDALVSVVTGAAPEPTRVRVESGAAEPDREAGEPDAGGTVSPAYEVMYLLEARADTVRPLKEKLVGLGESVLVVGAEPTWNVHAHVDDVGAAVEAGIEAGRPYRIRVTYLLDATRATAGEAAADGRGVVSVVAGDGLGALCESAGAAVVRGGPGRRASTAELLEGLRATRARDIVVLPNDADSLAVAEAAAGKARDEGLRVAVIPTRASVQALAALAVHDPQRRFEDDVVAMTAAAGHCRHGGVTVATREAVTMAGVCRTGDVLGIVDGDFAVIGNDLAEVARTVVDRMLGSGGELVTLVTGAPGSAGDADPQALAQAVVEHLHRTRPEVDAVVYDGGQPRYPLLIGVE